MKIGIITFHWGTNYGGVLQAYALQEFLEKMGFNVQIINYAPRTYRDSILYCFKTKQPKFIYRNLKEYFKERNFVPFRKKYLNTTHRYYSLEELQKDAPKMDVYISGSDQVWNPYIVKTYGKPYYLSFGADTIKRISYAVSFGCIDYPQAVLEEVAPFIKRFNALSVRENTGLEIMKHAEIDNATLMPDPTLLLCQSDFDHLINKNEKEKDYAFFYILQENQKLIEQLHEFTRSGLKLDSFNNKKIGDSFIGIEKWLSEIKNSRFVVTNSFHGVVFSILFQKNFVVVPIEGKLTGMNDRIVTLLEQFNLQNRILSIYDESKFQEIIKTNINWNRIKKVQKLLKVSAIDFLNRNLL